MSIVKIRVGPEAHRPFIIFDAEEKNIDVFYLNDIQECIGILSSTLIGVIRGTRFGNAWPQMVIPFHHNGGPACLELTMLPTPVGSDVEMEFREYPIATVWGWRDPKYSEYKLLHATTMPPQQVADMLHGVLNKLVRDRLMDIYDKDKTTLKMALDAIEIFDREGKNLEWLQASLTLPPVAVAESDKCPA